MASQTNIKNLLDYLEAGHTLDEFLDQFPSLAEKRPSRRWNTRKSS